MSDERDELDKKIDDFVNKRLDGLSQCQWGAIDHHVRGISYQSNPSEDEFREHQRLKAEARRESIEWLCMGFFLGFLTALALSWLAASMI